MENRGTKFIISILIILVFWLFTSMPTNTHTFFYRSYINEKVSSDIMTTRGYLNDILTERIAQERMRNTIADLKNKVSIKLVDLRAEIMNPENRGDGEKTKDILAGFTPLLGTHIETMSSGRRSMGIFNLERRYNDYANKISSALDSKIREIEEGFAPLPKSEREEVGRVYHQLGNIQLDIDDEARLLTDPKDVAEICTELNKGYEQIKKHHEKYVHFGDDEEKARYTAANPQTKVRRMLNVFDVWKDFFKGEYPLSFIFWILISILVDIAAFIFFDIAFKKNEF